MQTTTDTQKIMYDIKEESSRLAGLNVEVGKLIVGQEDILNFIMITILCDGHILLEGVPGVAKTSIIKAVTKALGLTFSRIQFTPDLLPADLIGTLIYNPKTQEFMTRKGPLFAHLILADEINRAPAKVQAALLEAMQEKQVTIGSVTYPLPEPFLVLATQNPIEQEGTYRLPEAQVDRFMFKVTLGYPSKEAEREIILRNAKQIEINPIISPEDIISAKNLMRQIYVDDKIIDYIVHIVHATRTPLAYGFKDIAPYIEYGVSPRAAITLYNASRARAFIKQRHFVTPDDVKAVALPSLSHRLVLTFNAEADNVQADLIIKKILATVPSP